MGKMVFRNYGGDYQLRLESADDLERIAELPDARWASTSAPLGDFSCDPAFLKYVDSDTNGRIRSDELRDAVRWLLHILKNRDRLTEQTETLRLGEINDADPEGARIRAAAERVLSNLGLDETPEITLANVRSQQSIMANAANNGDGVIPPSAAPDGDTAQLIRDAMASVGSVRDAGGEEGITLAQLETFEKEARAFIEWQDKGRVPDDGSTTDVHPWGADTAEAARIVAALDDKAREYFAQCDMVKFDPRAAEQMRLREAEIKELDFGNREAVEARLRAAPLAPPTAEDVLDLAGPVNAAYERDLTALRQKVVPRALGRALDRLTRDDWDRIVSIFAAHRAWVGGKQGACVERLGRERLEECLTGESRDAVAQMIAADAAVAGELERIGAVERLILYQRWLLEFANNMVSFPRLYDPEHRALFEKGTLIIDGRELTFSVRVDDRKQHRKLAENSGMYVLYLEITGRGGDKADKSFEVSTAVTSGESTGLYVGKRGVFFTPDGVEWDARVVDIIVNPVSLGEAARAPFSKMGEFVTRQIEKFGKAQEAKLEKAVAAPAGSSATRDLLLAGSVGLAALGSSFAYITKSMKGVQPHHVLLVVLGILAVLLGPSIVIAWFRLRRRDLTALLEASGWAVNVRIRVRGKLGRLFTHEPDLPKGSLKERRDLVARFTKDVGRQAINWTRVTILCLSAATLIFGGTLYTIVRNQPDRLAQKEARQVQQKAPANAKQARPTPQKPATKTP